MAASRTNAVSIASVFGQSICTVIPAASAWYWRAGNTSVPYSGVRILHCAQQSVGAFGIGRPVMPRDPDEPLGELPHLLAALGVVTVDRQLVDDQGVDVGAGVKLFSDDFTPS